MLLLYEHPAASSVFFLKALITNTILFSAKSLTAMSSFHINPEFYVVLQRTSSRIAPLQKICFPIKPDIFYFYYSQKTFNRHFLPIYHMYYRKKRAFSWKKSYFAPRSMI